MNNIEQQHRLPILVLGCTGSVGTQALDVARRLHFPVDGICAHRQVDAVEKYAREFGVRVCAMSDAAAADALAVKLADTKTKVYRGSEGILQMIAESPAHIAVNSILGEAGLAPTLAVLESGKQLALANKESLVVAGDIVMEKARQKGISIRPVDSEHCAIAECLSAGKHKEVKKLILTASGGPFFGRSRQELAGVRRADALAHPTWQMGQKITVDSATMMNKGFEIIEAAHLFGMKQEDIEVVVHRESIIHSMVEYIDHSIMAQLSVPDMRHCIQHALTHPDRETGVIQPLSLTKVGALSFYAPDEDTFTLLRLARRGLSQGGAVSAAINAANEVVVAAFLADRIGFCDIFDTVEETVDRLDGAALARTLEDIIDCDRRARAIATDLLCRRER